jgi:hypothetical protein
MKFKRKGKQAFIILSFLLVLVLHGKAQTNMVFYPAENQINSPSLNPAFLTSQNKFTFSIFPLSGMNVGYDNQLVIKNMLFKILKGDQTNDDFKDVFNSMVKLDLFYQRMENNIMNIGCNSNFGSFDFRIKENMQLMTDLKGDFSEMVTNTSLQTFPQSIRQQTFPAIALYYREYSIGYAKEVIKGKFAVGIRAKLYFGKSSMVSDVSGTVVPNSDNSIDLQTSGLLKISTPLKIITDNSVLSAVELSNGFTVGNYLMNSHNTGTGFDVGFNYKLTPDLALSASLVDVGAIKWNNNLNTMKFVGNGTIKPGPASSPRIDDFSQLYKIETDSLPFSTSLPTTFYAGLKYRLDPKWNISIVNRFISTQSMSFNSLSVTGVYDVKKNLSISSGYSIIGKSYSNIPFAILYTGEAGQYYVGTDNLLSMIAPSTSDFSGITFGMCFFLFRNKSKFKEHEYLPFYKEKKIISVNRNGLIKRNSFEE